MTTIADELEAIERAAVGGTSSASMPAAQGGEGVRRGSSLFASSGVTSDTAGMNESGGDILVDFPEKGGKPTSGGGDLPSEGGGPRRGSVVMQPVALAALAGLDDSDYDDSDDEGGPKGSAPEPPRISNPAAVGGPEHRPMVGGFAAAAYEAARADYYKKMGKSVTTTTRASGRQA